MEPKQVLPLCVREDLEVMALHRTEAAPQKVFQFHTQDTLFAEQGLTPLQRIQSAHSSP